jgi:hypothetical protein
MTGAAVGGRVRGSMAKEAITGLVWRDDAVEWTTLRAGRGEPVASGRERLAAAQGVEEEGAPDAAAPAECLKAACSAIPRGPVSLAVGSEHVLLRVLDLPATDDAELAAIITLQADKFSPFPLDTMVVGWEALRREGAATRALVAAVRREVVDEQGRRLAEAGLSIGRVDAAVLGWCALLARAGEIAPDLRDVVLLCDAGPPEVVVFDQGLPVLFRALDACAGLAGDALAGELAHEVGYTLMSAEMEQGAAVRQRVTLWGATDMAAAAGRIGADCGCEARACRLEALGALSEGVALRAARREGLDLTPPAWRAAERSRTFRRRLVGAAVALGGLWIAGAAVLLGGLAVENAREAGLRREQARWREPADAVRELRRRTAIVKRYMDRGDSALEFLRAVSAVLPAGVELTSFSYRKGEELRLSGEADRVEQVYEFKNAIDAGDMFQGESILQGPRADRRKRKEVFDIIVELPGDPA